MGVSLLVGSVLAMLAVVAVLPWVLLASTPVIWPAAAGGPAGRLVAAVRTGSRPVWDAALHPLSVLALAFLVALSLVRRGRRQLTWKSRQLP